MNAQYDQGDDAALDEFFDATLGAEARDEARDDVREEREETGDRTELARELSRIGEVTTPEQLGHKGVKRVRKVKLEELHVLIEGAVDRAFEQRGIQGGERNALVEDTRALLSAVAGGDPDTRSKVLERRLTKLADALDRSEHALADVLDDVDTGLPSARRYVASLPDEHPLRRRAEEKLGRLIASRVRSQQIDLDAEEQQRAEERRSLLRSLAAVNGLDEELEGHRPLASEAVVRELARRDAHELRIVGDTETKRVAEMAEIADEDEQPPVVSNFAKADADNLRLKIEEARPHLGFGWNSRFTKRG